MLESLASNGIGVAEDGLAARAPRTVNEIRRVPAIVEILLALDKLHYVAGKPRVPRASDTLVRAEGASQDKQGAFLARLGLQVLVWLRHFDSHTRFDEDVASRSGLTEAIVAEAARAAAEALVLAQSAAFEVDREGALRPRTSTLPTAGGD